MWIPGCIRAVLAEMTFWRSMRVVSMLVLILVALSITVDAYNLKQVFTWVKDRTLDLSWEPPAGEFHHYRLEISRTNLLSEPVVTGIGFDYTLENEYTMELDDDTSYAYRVQAVSEYGALSDYSEPTQLFIYEGGQLAGETFVADERPTQFSLSQNYPNPFNNATTIEYEISNAARTPHVELSIYSITGQKVRTLVEHEQPPGIYHAVWDGRDGDGNEVAAGGYLYLINAGSFRMSKKMIFLK